MSQAKQGGVILWIYGSDKLKIRSGNPVPAQISLQHFDNVFRQGIFDFAVPGNGLARLGRRVMIPVVISAMADEQAAHCLDGPDQCGALHATCRSPTRWTQGMWSALRSL